MAEALEAWLILDSEADETGSVNANPLLGNIERVCLERSEMIGESPLLTYRVIHTANKGVLTPQMVMLYGDAGTMLLALESEKHPGQYFVSRHAIGTVYVVGRTPSLPSDQQLKSILYHPEDQPTVVVMKRDFLSTPARQEISINCNLTQEGCDKPKK